ncbi:MAG: FAD-dependent oxidoreductase [Candidatus Acidiferrales bacterium]
MAEPMEKVSENAGTVEARAEGSVADVRATTCCVVGGGPGGVMLALLLARKNVDVTLLEMHKDFEREFRGDTVHPSTMEILDQIGLTDRLLQLPHTKISGPTIQAANGPFTRIDLGRLKTKFPYIMLMHQPILLEFLVREAAKYPNFRLVMGANVTQLIEEKGAVCGVRYISEDGRHDVRAALTVGADGRFSKIRQLAGFKPVQSSPPMDVLWFRLPRLAEDPELKGGAAGGIRNGHILIVLDRRDYWQVGYVVAKGHYAEIRTAGLEALRKSIAQIDPRFAPHAEHLTAWHQVSLLSVEASRCPRWYKPGLLLIGDAAHVMSPVGGVGINYAVQDAVVAANVLIAPLRAGRVEVASLAEVQRQREWPTRFIQAMQSFLQKRLIGSALKSSGPLQIPRYVRLLFRVPLLRDLPARLIAFGIKRVRVKD